MKSNRLVKTGLILAASLLLNCKPIINYPNTTEETGAGENTETEETVETEEPEDVTEETETEEPFEKYAELIQQYKSGNIPIRNYNDSFTLEWDNGSKNIDVKYKQRFNGDWLLLGNSGMNEFLVSGLEPGIYEFAVHDKELDATHTSLDQYAQPASGWFLMHKRTPEADLDLDGRISDAEMRLFIDEWLEKKFTDQQFSLNADFYIFQG